ncbi:hypothetical protein QS468_25560 [Bacillus subtilis]|nr:hypothetical protein [Pseudomonas sp. A29(2023)]MDL5596108.1 hypothetical protein [Bacillus subtilis]
MIEMPSKAPYKTIPENAHSIGRVLRSFLEKYWPDELFSEFCNRTDIIASAGVVEPEDIFNIWNNKELGIQAENVKISFALSVAYYLRATQAVENKEIELTSLMTSCAQYHFGYARGYLAYVEAAEIDAKKRLSSGDAIQAANRHIESELIRLINSHTPESINTKNKAIEKFQLNLESFIQKNNYGKIAASAANFIKKHLSEINGEARNQWLSKIGRPQDSGYEPRSPRAEEAPRARLTKTLRSPDFWLPLPEGNEPAKFRIPIMNRPVSSRNTEANEANEANTNDPLNTSKQS